MAEAAVAGGMLGMMALGVASLAGNMGDASKKAEGLVARTEFTSSLTTYLSSNLGCEDLKATSAAASLTESPRPISFTKWNYGGFSNIVAGTDKNNRKLTTFKYFYLEELNAYLKPETDRQLISAATPLGGVEILEKATLTVRVTIVIDERPYKHIYNLPVLVTQGTHELRFCSDEKTIAESCAAMRGVYDPVNKECDMADGCLLKGTYNELSCSEPPCDPRIADANKVNEFTKGQSCPKGSVSFRTHTSSWTQKRNCGKKCTKDVVNSMSWYNCMACPP